MRLWWTYSACIQTPPPAAGSQTHGFNPVVIGKAMIVLLLACVFVYAAASKAANYTVFVNDVESHGLLSPQSVGLASIALIIIEFVCAGWLLLSVPSSSRGPLMLCCASFLFFIGYAWLVAAAEGSSSAATSCGCGLPLLDDTNTIWESVIMRNGMLLALSVVALILDGLTSTPKRFRDASDVAPEAVARVAERAPS